ncbi:hypothetical protein HMPREF0381_0319 [Lachnoanaerobaculum saburreum DSM 3986]|uniref:Uncharacterized protein n=1 Tax=Lachnoanaerobaculum saburreum DSM 3986 TaxID=887325 RepID=E6LK34_9FIRM|nr:hypothetical protein HMPREF0381_0319 [Lachnoanaerobaculum saburreum DSM 3986]
MSRKENPHIPILNTILLESNKKIKINFNFENIALLYTGIIKVPKIFLISL